MIHTICDSFLQPPEDPPSSDYCCVCEVTDISAVRIFEILNQIDELLQYSIRNEYNYSKFSNSYRHQFLTYLTE